MTPQIPKPPPRRFKLGFGLWTKIIGFLIFLALVAGIWVFPSRQNHGGNAKTVTPRNPPVATASARPGTTSPTQHDPNALPPADLQVWCGIEPMGLGICDPRAGATALPPDLAANASPEQYVQRAWTIRTRAIEQGNLWLLAQADTRFHEAFEADAAVIHANGPIPGFETTNAIVDLSVVTNPDTTLNATLYTRTALGKTAEGTMWILIQSLGDDNYYLNNVQ
ncbi:hypothetical protein [Longispora fulva]|uniref:Uncharacterized protein n=1 Tax=Longispora fulva TaxID=619741 RepID=A0A8J7GSY1_9ACTN|nr:hypothetical protein [Longispora fulva]MBG6136516.1 hypothetical protein [Longispora fulva]